MAKKGMRRPGSDEVHSEENPKRPKNSVQPVPEIQGKAKTGNKKAGNIIDPGEAQ